MIQIRTCTRTNGKLALYLIYLCLILQGVQLLVCDCTYKWKASLMSDVLVSHITGCAAVSV